MYIYVIVFLKFEQTLPLKERDSSNNGMLRSKRESVVLHDNHHYSIIVNKEDKNCLANCYQIEFEMNHFFLIAYFIYA